MNYVCGFLFFRGRLCPAFDAMSVVLIRKARPEWQKGKLNGVGGKVESGETPDEAMTREFREETGVEKDLKWERFCEARYRDGTVHFYRAFTKEALDLKSEDGTEVPDWYPLAEYVRSESVVPNLKYLLPMAVDEKRPFATIHEEKS